MGLLSFLGIGGGKGGALDRHAARARNKDAQSVDRFGSLEALAGAAHDEVKAAEKGDAEMRAKAVLGLLGRFTIRCDKTIEDEQEKEYVFAQLSSLGPSILPEVEHHLHAAESIAWGLRLLGEVATPDEAWPVLERLCERNDNNYTRDPSKKTQLVHYLGEQQDPRAGEALVPYLEDVDEGVRFTAVEGVLGLLPESAREPLFRRLADEGEPSRRIKRRIVEGMADAGWDIRSGATKLADSAIADLLPGATVDKQGRVRRGSDK
ncbi:MAG: hypothetical protein ABI321_06765 [Polyangia bacterium]